RRRCGRRRARPVAQGRPVGAGRVGARAPGRRLPGGGRAGPPRCGAGGRGGWGAEHQQLTYSAGTSAVAMVALTAAAAPAFLGWTTAALGAVWNVQVAAADAAAACVQRL